MSKRFSFLVETITLNPVADPLAQTTIYKNKKRKARLKIQERQEKVNWWRSHASLIDHYPSKFYTEKTMAENPKWQDKRRVMNELKKLGCKFKHENLRIFSEDSVIKK